jgi:hypothetical protein
MAGGKIGKLVTEGGVSDTTAPKTPVAKDVSREDLKKRVRKNEGKR